MASTPLHWIDSDQDLIDFCNRSSNSPYMTFDTEFIRERTYYPILALVQIGTDDELACIDPLAGINLAPLEALLFDDTIVKVVHSGRQDFEIFYNLSKKVIAPVFDTQIAAALLGLGEQVGYGALVNTICGATISKAYSRADWTRRPLDQKVIDYAADDVRYLRDIYKQLNTDLENKGRRSWLDEEQQTLLDPQTYDPDIHKMWERTKGSGRLKGVACAIAQQVAAWRELEAQSEDRPRNRILPDEIILDLAKQQPTSMQQMLRLRGLESKIAKRYREPVLEAVTKALNTPESDWPASLDKGKKATIDEGLTNILQAIVQIQANKHSISPALLASSRDLKNAAAGERNLPFLQGWRYELAGQAVCNFLDGKSTLKVTAGKLVFTEE